MTLPSNIHQNDFLAALNTNQRAAAEHPAGPLLVIAGAGTGKTKTLAARVARLIRAGASPGRILRSVSPCRWSWRKSCAPQSRGSNAAVGLPTDRRASCTIRKGAAAGTMNIVLYFAGTK